LESGNRRVTGLSFDNAEAFDTPFTRRDNPHRAYLTIIEGCDKSCAYCVVPFTRGPERSRTSESAMAEARGLAEKGYTEVQLLGQNVNSYRDPSPAGWDFATLLGRVAEIPGMRRVRYTTSHPRDFVRGIVDAMDANPAICDHIHLPVQSGSSRVLAAMDRLYTRAVIPSPPMSSSVSPARPMPISSRPSICSTRSNTIPSSASNTRRVPIPQRLP
jgi:tRNA-2-methylthio-N6-dimethylallyladenosine synthase